MCAFMKISLKPSSSTCDQKSLLTEASRLTSAHADVLSDTQHQIRRRAMLMVRMWSPPQSSPLSSWYNPFQWCKNRTYSEETLFYFTLILNQILIHILYWLGLRSEIDQLIILQNKRAGESKRPSRATSSPLRRRSSYYDQRLLKHTHRPHMWTPSTHTHTHNSQGLHLIYRVFIHLTGTLTTASQISNTTRRSLFYVRV